MATSLGELGYSTVSELYAAVNSDTEVCASSCTDTWADVCEGQMPNPDVTSTVKCMHLDACVSSRHEAAKSAMPMLGGGRRGRVRCHRGRVRPPRHAGKALLDTAPVRACAVTLLIASQLDVDRDSLDDLERALNGLFAPRRDPGGEGKDPDGESEVEANSVASRLDSKWVVHQVQHCDCWTVLCQTLLLSFENALTFRSFLLLNKNQVPIRAPSTSLRPRPSRGPTTTQRSSPAWQHSSRASCAGRSVLIGHWLPACDSRAVLSVCVWHV